MVGLIIAVSVVSTLLVATIVVGAIKIYRLEETLTNLAQCFLAYTENPDSINIVQDITRHSDFNFPNSEGFDK